MKNLFERLKPEHLQMLNDAEELYPLTIPNIFKNLESNYFWCDMSYECIFTLLNHLDIHDLSPRTIESLFDND